MRIQPLNCLIVSLIMILFVMTSCGNEKDKIGILIPASTFQADLEDLTKIFQGKNIEVLSANAQLDASSQIEQANALIEKGVSIMIIIPVNTYTSAEIVRNCHANNIKTIAYERLISNCDLDYYVSFDNVHVGELLAECALKYKPQGKYMIFNGDKTDRNALRVNQGMMKVLTPQIQSGNIEVVYQTFIEGWLQDNAQYEFEQYIGATMPMPDVILSAHNRMSNGILNVLGRLNLNEFPIITGQGQDTPESRQAWNSNQRISLFKSYKVECKATANLALKILRNEKVIISQHINNGLYDVPSIVISEMSLETH